MDMLNMDVYNNVLTQTANSAEGTKAKNSAVCKEAKNSAIGTAANQDMSLSDVLQNLYDIQQERKKLADMEKRMKEQAVRMAEDKNVVLGGYAFVKEQRKGAVNYSAIPQLNGVDLEMYRKTPVTIWKLTKLMD